MSQTPQARTTRHPLTRAGSALAISLTVAAIPALAPAETPVVDATRVTLAAQSSALPVSEQQQVLDDFAQGGLAQVILHQFTSRTTDPAQLQIINDFYQGGVFQSEAHRFLQLFTDPQQQEFINDFVTGGVVQVVRNRLLDATTDPAQRGAIIAFFPDEVTDYRGGPITMLQRRLIAAAKGNTAVIALVNAAFDNPIVGAVRHLVGGGPIIGTPLGSLPETTVTPATTPTTPAAEAVSPAEPAVVAKTPTAASTASRLATEPVVESTPKVTQTAEPDESEDASKAADVSPAGGKVKPSTTPKSGGGILGVFGHVAESIAKGLAGQTATAAAPGAASGASEAAGGVRAGNDGAASKSAGDNNSGSAGGEN